MRTANCIPPVVEADRCHQNMLLQHQTSCAENCSTSTMSMFVAVRVQLQRPSNHAYVTWLDTARSEIIRDNCFVAAVSRIQSLNSS